jgi:hypothetical protein
VAGKQTDPVSSSSPFPLRQNPHLYEINTWCWLDQLSAKLGRNITLAEVPDAEWDAIAQKGFDIVWLMGVWRRSAISRQIELDDKVARANYDKILPGWTPADVIGSPYSVSEYTPDPRIGKWSDIDVIRGKLHARKIALFLDFVGNHTALDHPWLKSNPEYYVQGSAADYQRNSASFYKVDFPQGAVYFALGKDPYFPPWKDVAQLNHFQTGMRAAHIADLKTIAGHCDGVRCDMAMLQLNDIFGKLWQAFLGETTPPAQEFWSEARAMCPGLIMLAEAYWGTERRLLDLGFSFVYDKGFYDSVRDEKISEVRGRLSIPASDQSHLARFLENHDEERCAAVFGKQRVASVGTLMGSLPGLRFYYQGELEGCRIHQPIELGRFPVEPVDSEIAVFFQKILAITNGETFHSAQWTLLPINSEGDISPDGLIAYEWRSSNVWKLVVVNLLAGASQGRIPLGERVAADRQYVFYDELNDVRYARSGEELHDSGLFVRREGFQAHLFDVTIA